MHRVYLLFIDLILIVAATVSALVLRDNLEVSSERVIQLLPYLLLTIVTATPVLLTFGLNRTVWRFSDFGDYVRIALAVAVAVLFAVSLGFLLNRMEGVARSLPIVQGLLMVCALAGVRVAMRLRHASRNRAPRLAPALTGERQELVVIIGLNSVAELFLRSVQEFGGERIKVAGLLGRERHRGRLLRRHPVLGAIEEIEKVLGELEVHGMPIDRLVLTISFEDLSPAARQALFRVEQRSDIQLDFFAERVVFNVNNGRPPLSDRHRPSADDGERIGALARLDLVALASRPYFRRKRMVEAALATVLVTLLVPVAVVVGLIVTLAAGPAPIFWQQRPGARGRPFKLYKFRTMASAHDRHGRRRTDAERLSCIGRILRRLRLDELPQLYNVLVGEMSFVGPRPLLPADQSSAFAARLAVRPGLTGWAQIKGGRELTAADKAVLDIWYIQNASLSLDLKILLGTVGMILFGERTDRDAIDQAWRSLGLGRLHQEQRLASADRSIDESTSHLQIRPRRKYEGVAHVTALPEARSRA